MSEWPELHIQNVSLTRAETASVFIGYAQRHPATLRYYDLRPDDTPDQVTVTDLGCMVLINARLSGDDAATLLKYANAPHTDWTRFRPDLAISDAVVDPADRASDSPWQAMQEQYEILDRKGLGNAKITKLLHRKRPQLFPIVDSFVRRFYATCGISRHHWEAIRRDVITNTGAFEQLRATASGHHDPDVQQLAQLTDLRLIDIAIWSIIDKGNRAHHDPA